MKHFTDHLIERIETLGNPTVMGLDPRLENMPPALWQEAEGKTQAERAAAAIVKFNRGLMEAVQDIVPAVKPQLAYYELYGTAGIEAFAETCRMAKQMGFVVIADGKRNDIGSTAGAYAQAFLGETVYPDGSRSRSFEADCLTANAYLGIDGIAPFLETGVPAGRGIFALLRTSNPSAEDLQNLKLEDGKLLYEKMADLLDQWGEPYRGEFGYSALGAVVGATWPEEAGKLRKAHPHLFFLVPGYGAQGGDASSVRPNFDSKGRGAIVNASRSLIYAWKKKQTEDYQEATRAEAMAMREALRKALLHFN